MDCTRRAPAERRPGERRVNVELVHAVPELVHRREKRSEVTLVRVSRQANVTDAGLCGKWVRRFVEPPGLRVVAKRLQHQAPSLLLAPNRVRACDLFDRITSMPVDEVNELTLQPPEDLLDLGRREPFLVLIEENVVRLLGLGKARDIPTLELELTLEMRAEGLEVRRSLRLVPRGH